MKKLISILIVALLTGWSGTLWVNGVATEAAPSGLESLIPVSLSGLSGQSVQLIQRAKSLESGILLEKLKVGDSCCGMRFAVIMNEAKPCELEALLTFGLVAEPDGKPSSSREPLLLEKDHSVLLELVKRSQREKKGILIQKDDRPYVILMSYDLYEKHLKQ